MEDSSQNKYPSTTGVMNRDIRLQIDTTTLNALTVPKIIGHNNVKTRITNNVLTAEVTINHLTHPVYLRRFARIKNDIEKEQTSSPNMYKLLHGKKMHGKEHILEQNPKTTKRTSRKRKRHTQNNSTYQWRRIPELTPPPKKKLKYTQYKYNIRHNKHDILSGSYK